MLPRRSNPVPVVHSSAFVGFRFPPEIIVLAVRWYLRYALSYRDVEELRAERGIVPEWGMQKTDLACGFARGWERISRIRERDNRQGITMTGRCVGNPGSPMGNAVP